MKETMRMSSDYFHYYTVWPLHIIQSLYVTTFLNYFLKTWSIDVLADLFMLAPLFKLL